MDQLEEISQQGTPNLQPRALLHLSGCPGGKGLAQTSQGRKSSPGESMLSAWPAPTESVFANKGLLGLLHRDPKLSVRILSELQTCLVLGDPGCGSSIGTILCPLHPPGPNQDWFDAGQEQPKVGMGRRKT